MMARARIVFNKEVADNLRDRRTLLAALAYPLLGPAIMMLVFTTLVRVQVEANFEQKTIDASWVIAADGAHSAVRKSVGIEFEGFTWSERFITEKSNSAGRSNTVRTRSAASCAPACATDTAARLAVEVKAWSFAAGPWFQPSPISAWSSKFSRRV